MTMTQGNGFYLDERDSEIEQTIKLAQGYLSRFRYKPNWQFEMTRQPQMGAACIRIMVLVDDSRGFDGRGEPWTRHCSACGQDSGLKIPIEGMYPIPRLTEMADPEKRFFDFLRQCIWSVERHESDEWIRVDGELLHDPHAGDWMAAR